MSFVTVLTSSMVFPACALMVFALTFVGAIGGTRMLNMKRKEVTVPQFQLMYVKLPTTSHVVTRHFANLFEVPTLFYASVGFILATGLDDPTFTLLGWCFVIVRFIHAIIHLTYNNLNHRGGIFTLGSMIQLAIVIRIFLAMYHRKASELSL